MKSVTANDESRTVPSQSQKPASDLYTREEAAAYLGVTESTLAVWKCTGRYNLPCVMVGRIPRYRKSDLDAWIASRTVCLQAA